MVEIVLEIGELTFAQRATLDAMFGAGKWRGICQPPSEADARKGQPYIYILPKLPPNCRHDGTVLAPAVSSTPHGEAFMGFSASDGKFYTCPLVEDK